MVLKEIMGNMHMKRHLTLKIILGILATILIALAVFILYLSITEYRPKDSQTAEYVSVRSENVKSVEDELTIYSWNIGYAGLDAGTDFFMDGGTKVNPKQEDVQNNLDAITEFIGTQQADAWLLQEVDVDSARTGHLNELSAIAQSYDGSYGLAYNYKCDFVPIPWPPIGKMASGIATFTNHSVKGSFTRVALPCPFSWPVSIANLKRCLLVTRLAVEGSDKEVVLINLHLEAYDDGEGKLAQTKLLVELLQQEYRKGNYVIAGGDFNQTFPGSLGIYPVRDDVWTPGTLGEDDLPESFAYAYDLSHATCRSLNAPLGDDSQMYVIDGFIVSSNVQVDAVETVDLGFANSDHNPVKLQIHLKS